jgi:hypothetical protein
MNRVFPQAHHVSAKKAEKSSSSCGGKIRITHTFIFTLSLQAFSLSFWFKLSREFFSHGSFSLIV